MVQTVPVRTPEADDALRWLAGRGVVPLAPGRWQQAGPPGGADPPDGAGPPGGADPPYAAEPLSAERSDNDLAHEWAEVLLDDERLPPVRRLRTGLGLLDLLDEYWVTVELRWFVTGRDDPELTGAFWAGYRQRLEAAGPCAQVLYSLWVDWFEDRDTAGPAFAAVLGADVRRLRAASDLRALATGGPHRRAVRVLEHSGPVPWAVKHDVYEAAAAVPELHPALVTGLLGGYHDVYGDLDPAAAVALLDRLEPSERGERLRAALSTGPRRGGR